MLERLADGVWQVDLLGVNAYVVDDGGDATLIDAGLPWQAGAVSTALRTAANGPESIERVLVTHYDIDHVGGLGRIAGLDASVYAGKPDVDYLRGTGTPPVRRRKGLFQRATGLAVKRPHGQVVTVADGDTVGGFACYHTPGHTAGHFSYVHAERSVALLGDVVRTTDGRFAPAPALLSDDGAAVRRSIRDLVARAPAFDVGAPGHGSPIVGDASAALKRAADR